jgi:hypothetical protein
VLGIFIALAEFESANLGSNGMHAKCYTTEETVAFYCIIVQSKKRYHKIYFHIIDLMCTNAWFVHWHDATELKIPFCDFKIQIMQGECLMRSF